MNTNTEISIITDTHQGIKNDAGFMLDYQEKFYSEAFFPKLKEKQVEHLFHLGDLFDRRKYINFMTLARTRKMFLDKLKENGIKMYIIPGNHDIFFKSSNEINSLSTLLNEYILNGSVEVIESPKIITIYGQEYAFIPWINNENYAEYMSFITSIRNKKDVILCGHFEIAGFEMYAGTKADHGMDAAMFSEFKHVWSGHFHHKSTVNNISYLGAPMEFTFADCDDPRGFHFYKAETNDLTFIRNGFTLYEKVYYNDETEEGQEYFRNLDIQKTFSGKIVKLYVVKKTKSAIFESFVDKLFTEGNLINLSIIEDYSEFHESFVQDDIVEATTTTKDLIEKYIDYIETPMDKARLKSLLTTLYIEAENYKDTIAANKASD